MEERFVRLAQLDIVPERLDEYLAHLREEIAQSLEREPGVLMLQAVGEKSAPCRIHLLEVYVSRAAYEAHIQTAHFLRYKQATMDMVADLKLIDANPIMLSL